MITSSASFDFTSALLDARITFARTTGASNPASYVGSDGYIALSSNNQPRFDYDPVTLLCKGLLIEESRTNLALYSEDPSDITWAVSNVLKTSDNNPDPFNGTKALLATANGTNNRHFVYTNDGNLTNYVDGTTYTLSVFVKPDTANRVQLTFPGPVAGTSQYANFLLDGVGSVTGLSGGTAGIDVSADGFYRIFFSVTATATVSNTAGNIAFITSGTDGRLPINSSSGQFYIVGWQMEAGAFPTSYIPTTTTALTRNADVATITGTDFSDWWQAGRGGVSVSAIPSTVSGTRPLIQFDDNTADNLIALQGNTTNPELYIVDSTTPQAQIDAGTIAAGTPYTLTGWWQTDFCAARKDNGAKVIDNSATIPTVTQARLGSDGTNYLNGHLATINYYDQFSSRIYTRRKNKAVFSVL